MTAARIGFGWSFIIAGVLLCTSAWIVAWGVPSIEPLPPPPEAATASWAEVLGVSLLSLAGSAQVAFLPAILPDVLADLGVEEVRRLEVGGLVVFATGAAAAVGSFASPRIGDLLGERAAVGWMVGASGVGLCLLAVAPTVGWFAVVRVLQVFCIAPLFPLLFAHIAQRVRSQVFGLVNSSRIAASFLGPIVATTLLAHAAPPAVYLVLAIAAVPCLPLALRHLGQGGAAAEGRP